MLKTCKLVVIQIVIDVTRCIAEVDPLVVPGTNNASDTPEKLGFSVRGEVPKSPVWKGRQNEGGPFGIFPNNGPIYEPTKQVEHRLSIYELGRASQRNIQDVSLGGIIFDSEEGERAITYIPSSLDAGKLILRNVSYVYAIFESDALVADVTRKARVHAIKRGDIALILSNRHIGMNKRTYVEIDIYNRASMGFLHRCVIIGRLDHDSMENICNIKAEDSFTGSGPVGKLRISLSS